RGEPVAAPDVGRVTVFQSSASHQRPPRVSCCVRRRERVMTTDQVAAVVKSLTPDAHGWSAALPESAGQLLGQGVGMEIVARLYPAEGAAPSLSPAEAALVTAILNGLPAILAEAEQRYREHEANYPGACGGAYAPWISISRQELAESGPSRW